MSDQPWLVVAGGMFNILAAAVNIYVAVRNSAGARRNVQFARENEATAIALAFAARGLVPPRGCWPGVDETFEEWARRRGYMS